MNTNKLQLITGCCLLFFCSHLFAVTDNDARRAEITGSVKSFIHQQLTASGSINDDEKIDISVNTIDRRKRINECSQPLTLSLAGKNKLSRNTTVEVKCEGSWKIYIAVRIKRLKPIAVAAQTLSPGTVLDPANLVIAYKDTLTLHGTIVTDISSITGSKVKRHVQQGQPVTHNIICLVCNGDPVTIYARSGNLTIKSLGTALKDGSMGQVIAVKNNSSARRIEAVVVAVSEVEIKL